MAQKIIQTPYPVKEHKKIEQHAKKKRGFCSMAAYVRWLIANDMRGES